MKVRGQKANKVNVITLGCSKNLVDSEVLMGQLRANQFDVTHEAETNDANIVIVNTCGFIDNAKQESIDTILRYADEKEAGRLDKLYVMGCLSQRYKDELEVEIPQVDAYFGTLEMPQLMKKLEANYQHELVGERLITTPSHYAYFKIAEGCNRPCSFCAIPLMRGKHTDRSIEDLVREAKRLASMGTKELILIAQDLTYYGLQAYGERKLPDLLRHLSDVEGIEWIRMQYAYPSQFPMEALTVMAERDNICKYLDMPLQHISDNMLKTMRRGISKRRTIELVDTMRQRVPDIALRTTLIAGHPGETQQDFEELYQWVADTKFDRLGIFTYSHEESTHAYTLEDNVPAETKQDRADQIMELQQGISLELNEQKVGQTYKVLFDRKESGYFVGRTQYDSPEVDNEVLVPATPDTHVRLGDFAHVRINEASDFDLYGQLV
ncbi:MULTISPECIES: 30S ribosomal protein S12 methylthiotransferase RimO [Hymenobacter]|uniref:Ribosomal protein uS12 methylthiotransferase RimO n=2 Tax=Hymenobacter TaxID=89966 RepID=A0ABS6X5R7_9BACT|nr:MULTISPECIES: 30S ribosomal protein S12 methylthiotransferase RimO [Hymenobacter]MBO3270166.1 30S ribosomal protein S12 methylthiotransferase RimO [Hymenobacter defluvii]MBW3131196.1 30S ribosomal protein S12 methylthiotransferase RimO [Hymenobacter profundi]QNE41034.1 30S ribosomal protein S12 methylthiotransferase RimO [Hymenobacter sp. NBH84]